MWTVGWVDWPSGAFTPCEGECVIPNYRHPFFPPPDPPHELAECAQPWTAYFERDSIGPPASGSDSWAAPTTEDRSTFSAGLSALLAGRTASAAERALTLGHTLCADGDVVVWAPDAGSGRPIVAVRPDDAAAVVFEICCSFYDESTLAQGVALFEGLGARNLIASGTHRCASNVASGCDGTTTSCGDPARAYPISDQAHNVDTMFHAAHLAVSSHFDDALVVSLHEFAQDGASLSDGTTNDTFTDAPVARIATGLAAEFPDENITVCNRFEGAVRETRLCGTTNVQGRQLNGSVVACGEAAVEATWRFIHLEQSRTLREDDGAALIAAFEAALATDSD